MILILTHFIDGDLGEYHEFSTGVMVNPPGSNATGPRALPSAGTFIHQMLVDQEFTLEAGRTIWGYPKVMADFTIRDGRSSVSTSTSTAKFAVGMEFRPGLPIPSSFGSRPQKYPYVLVSGRVRRENQLARYRSAACAIDWVVCGYVSAITPTPKNLQSLGLPKRAMMFDFG